MSQGSTDSATSSRQQRLRILGQDEIEALYGLPRFSDEEREQYFALSATERIILDDLNFRLKKT